METIFIFSDDGTNVSLFIQTNTYSQLAQRLEPLSVFPLRKTMAEVVGRAERCWSGPSEFMLKTAFKMVHSEMCFSLRSII